MNNLVLKNQIFPILASFLTFIFLIFLILAEIKILNRFTAQDIMTNLKWSDVVFGMTIYLKTSVDFAIFIGNLMGKYRGWTNRIAIEIGSSLGNGIGTIIIIAIWTLFKEVTWLLAIMVAVASLVLLKMAEEGFEHVNDGEAKSHNWLQRTAHLMHGYLSKANSFFAPLMSKVIPNISIKNKEANLSFWSLTLFASSVPFILGLDDFAGYVPLFSVVNIFGFAIGVLLGHLVLNIALFISPDRTIQIVQHPVISFIGAFVFIGLAAYGFIEVGKMIGEILLHSA